MGNSLRCFSWSKTEEVNDPDEILVPPVPQPSFPSKRNSFFRRSFWSLERDDSQHEEKLIIREQARAALMLLKQYQRDGQVPYSRSASAVYRSQSSGKNKHNLPRSSTSRRRLFHDHNSLDLSQSQASITDGVETDRFILVHGGGFGAWCWYKTMALLTKVGFRVEAVNLTGSGIQSSETNSVKTMAQYVKPLVDLLDKLGDGEKVILVGHDFGGVCLSYVMELYPTRIAKAVFVAVTMLKNGQSALDMFSQEECQSLLMRQAQIFSYADGNNKPPTAIKFNKASFTDLLFNQNQCSTKDVMLASVSMRPIPFGPVMEKLSLSKAKHGLVRRFYIVAQEDFAIPASMQEAMIKADAPEGGFLHKRHRSLAFFLEASGTSSAVGRYSEDPPKVEESDVSAYLTTPVANYAIGGGVWCLRCRISSQLISVEV